MVENARTGTGPMKQVLVTGAQGFIGSHIARALVERGDRVTVVDRAQPLPGRSGLALQGIEAEVELVTASLTEPGVYSGLAGAARTGFDTVFHLAAQTLVGPAMADPPATFEANLTATWRLLQACQDGLAGRVVVASSDKAYGPSTELPYREEQALCPTAPYEASKAATEMIVRAYSGSSATAVTRLANVYGPGDLNSSRLVPELMAAVAQGRRPRIRSDGSPERDYIYIDDAVGAYLAIERLLEDSTAAGSASDRAEEAAYRVFNAGSGRPRSVRDLIAHLADAIERPIEADYLGDGVPVGEIDRQWVDSTKLREATGWHPTTDLGDGLRRTFDWYAAHAELLIAA